MKKLIAIAVVFALVAGAAFAETSVSGTIDTRITVVNANNQEGQDATIGGSVADGYVQLSGQDDDGKFGGLVRIRANENSPGSSEWSAGGGAFHRAFAWWQPIPQLRIFLGHDLDGKFATGQLTDWAFHQGAEGFVERHDWGFWRDIYPGNWDGFGLAFSVYPAPGIDINLVVPTGDTRWYQGNPDRAQRKLTWKQVPSSLRLESGIGIPDVGKIFISWIGPETAFSDLGDDASMGHLGASFYFTMIEGLQIQPGFSVDIPKGDYITPIRIGLAAHFAAGDFGVKFRSAFRLRNDSNEDNTFITFNVMPWYNLGVMTAYLDIGAELNMYKNADTNIYFWLNPYIRKSIGPGAIRAGIMVGIDPDPVADTVVTFQIPVQFTYSF